MPKQRERELVVVDGKKSRLTVTPNRVTVKVSKALGREGGQLYALGLAIADTIDLDRSVRGCFDMRSRTITLTTERRDVTLRYDFEGNTKEV